MRKFYLIYTITLVILFCFLQYRGYSMDSNHIFPSPSYYNSRGVGGGGFGHK